MNAGEAPGASPATRLNRGIAPLPFLRPLRQ